MASQRESDFASFQELVIMNATLFPVGCLVVEDLAFFVRAAFHRPYFPVAR